LQDEYQTQQDLEPEEQEIDKEPEQDQIEYYKKDEPEYFETEESYEPESKEPDEIEGKYEEAAEVLDVTPPSPPYTQVKEEDPNAEIIPQLSERHGVLTQDTDPESQQKKHEAYVQLAAQLDEIMEHGEQPIADTHSSGLGIYSIACHILTCLYFYA
jgi:hypothetical protein